MSVFPIPADAVDAALQGASAVGSSESSASRSPAKFRPVLVRTAPELRSPASHSGDRAVHELLVEACRAADTGLAGTEVVVDCDPARLEVAGPDVERLCRCASLLLDAALAGRAPAEIDLSAKATGTAESPLLLISVRSFVEGSSREERPAAWGDPGPVHVARIHMKQSVGTLLVSHRNSQESRFSLGLELSTRLAPRGPLGPIEPMEAKVVIADDNPRARRATRRLLEAEGYTVREATRPLELVALLDPDETMGVPPAWLLLDAGWTGPGARSRVGLVDLVAASLPPDRVLLLASAGDGAPEGAAGWDHLASPFAPAELLERLRHGVSPRHLRNAEAEMPYSLSRW